MAEVLVATPSPRESQVYLAAEALGRTPTPKPPRYVMEQQPYQNSANVNSIYQEIGEDTSSSSHSSPHSSPRQDAADYHTRPSLITPPSSISLDTRSTEEDLYFPSHNPIDFDKTHIAAHPPPASPITDDIYDGSASSATESTAETESSADSVNLPPVHDDTAVREEPSRQVDYLSHEWREEDIWSSWRHIVSRRNVYGERSRLENASWRSWAKSKYHLNTVSPKTLNWLKDCDVTWLYGPLQESQNLGRRRQGFETSSHHVNAGSFAHKKPILKKRTISEVMLQKSLSSSSLVKQAAAVVQAQRNSDSRERIRFRPRPGRTQSDIAGAGTPTFHLEQSDNLPSPFASNSTSGLESPDAGGKRHIRFDDKVEQCIAVDFELGGAAEDEVPSWAKDSDDSSDEELVMNIKPKRRASTPTTPRPSLNQENKGIAMLPSTKLKYHREEPACPGHPEVVFKPSWESRPGLHDSPSQETLRPSRPSTNFLIDETDDVDESEMSWAPAGAFGRLRRDTLAGTPLNSPIDRDDGTQSSGGLRRTASGMFMPLDDDEEQPFATAGILGRVVDTVNTARDIAHVIWNVGWRK